MNFRDYISYINKKFNKFKKCIDNKCRPVKTDLILAYQEYWEVIDISTDGGDFEAYAENISTKEKQWIKFKSIKNS